MRAETKQRTESMGRRRYTPPFNFDSASLQSLLERSHRDTLAEKQFNLLRSDAANKNVRIFFAGKLDLIFEPCVSIVGTRDVSDEGARRARKLAKELAKAGVVIVSGLARGVDRNAQESAIESDGNTIAVIGTPLDKAYPAENAELQELIYRV